MINVTSFFRDTDTHTYLKENLFPKLLKRKKTGETLRIWVPACATGEEAYSMAMMLLEIQEDKATTTRVQIFATDLSQQAINKARIGIYSKHDLETVSPKRIQRFFTKADGGFRVNKAVRDLCVFAPHNILHDPPFSRLDFISCCNLFIYFDNPAQKKAVNTFHYALNDDGFLMLGKSENITQSANLFTGFNKKYKIFLRKINSGSRTLPALLPRYVQQMLTEKNTTVTNKAKPNQTISVNHNNLDNAIDAVLVSEFMPASVVINHQMEIVQFRGTTDLFLTHPKGKATFNILKMARPEIAFELRNTISKVIKTKHCVRKSGIEFKINSAVKILSLEIVPLKIESAEPLLLILFTELEQVEVFRPASLQGTGGASLAKDRRIKKLEQELAAAQADALTIAQEQEAFTEELQSANEEVVSSNEELQTLNEEMETSKEEIESANEELTTTNQELQTRNDLLNEAYGYSEAVLATIHEPMLVLDKSLRVKSANKTFYKIFKVKEEDTEGELLYDLGNKQWNIPLLRELLEDLLPKNTHFHDFEITHTFPLIGEKTMLLNARRIIQKMNHEELILLAISDITEQTIARKRIAESEVQHAFLLKLSDALRLLSAPQQIKIKAMQVLGEHLNVSRCYFAEVLKDGKRCVIDNSFSSDLDPIDGTYRLEEFVKAKVAMLKRGEVILTANVANDTSVTQEERDKNLEMQIHAYINVPLVKDNKLICLLGVNQSVVRNWTKLDLTIVQETAERTWAALEKANAEEALHISEEKFRILFTSIDQGLTLCELIRNKVGKGIDICILEVNPTYEKQTGVNKEMVIGKPLLQVFPSLNKWIDIYADVVDNQRPVEYENYFEDTNRWFANKAYPIEKEKFAVLFSDITERKLYEKELIEAKLSAENAVKFKQQFLSNMSHEIRTPLNSILGFAKVLLKTKLSPEQTEFLQAIKTSGKTLNLLINDILDLAKVDAGKMTFENQPFEIRESITTILHSFDLKIKEKNLELVNEYDSKIPVILLGDSLRLNQIILNLVNNAVKFTHHGKIKISSKLLTETEHNVAIEFAITDSGIGIDDDKIDSIFNLFEQAELSIANTYGGTGLGLAIVKQLIENQGGSISVSSKIGEGSTFSFILPFGKTDIKSEEENEIIKLDSEIKSLRILVAEDVPLNQFLINIILSDFGFEPEVVGNGKLAIEKLQTNTYDIILMDLQMPEMNGFEATEYIRKTMKSQIPIVALTADVTTADVAKCQKFGMNDYISKPINENLLYSKIVELVKRKQ